MDSQWAIILLQSIDNSEHQHANLVARFRSLFRRDWRI
ncbi:hypothetical protein LINGRAHAP2_LOCUS15617 [Linum grandiflorum]